MILKKKKTDLNFYTLACLKVTTTLNFTTRKLKIKPLKLLKKTYPMQTIF